MSQHNVSNSGNLTTLFAGAILGAAGLAWWLLNESDRRREISLQKASKGSVIDDKNSASNKNGSNESSDTPRLEERVEKLYAEIERVREQLESLGSST